jgi:hypothetical protein
LHIRQVILISPPSLLPKVNPAETIVSLDVKKVGNSPIKGKLFFPYNKWDSVQMKGKYTCIIVQWVGGVKTR